MVEGVGGGERGGFRLRMPPSPSNRIRCVIFAAGQGMGEGGEQFLWRSLGEDKGSLILVLRENCHFD